MRPFSTHLFNPYPKYNRIGGPYMDLNSDVKKVTSTHCSFIHESDRKRDAKCECEVSKQKREKEREKVGKKEFLRKCSELNKCK